MALSGRVAVPRFPHSKKRSRVFTNEKEQNRGGSNALVLCHFFFFAPFGPPPLHTHMHALPPTLHYPSTAHLLLREPRVECHHRRVAQVHPRAVLGALALPERGPIGILPLRPAGVIVLLEALLQDEELRVERERHADEEEEGCV